MTSIILVIFLTYQAYRTWKFIDIGKGLAAKAVPFERVDKNAESSILIIGDSTVVGTGASDPTQSIAGRVGEVFPESSIVNMGTNGAKTVDLIPKLRDLESRYDLIMIHIGGNDVVRFTSYEQVKDSIEEVLRLAKTKSDRVTITSTGNVGTALLLPFGSRWIFEKRTRRVRDIFMKAARDLDVTYIDLFREKKEDPFHQNPSVYYASDLFHPSNAGYDSWFIRIGTALEEITLK